MIHAKLLGRLAELDELPPDALKVPGQLGLVDDKAERCRRSPAVLD
jgi:hypothetical protein